MKVHVKCRFDVVYHWCSNSIGNAIMQMIHGCLITCFVGFGLIFIRYMETCETCKILLVKASADRTYGRDAYCAETLLAVLWTWNFH